MSKHKPYALAFKAESAISIQSILGVHEVGTWNFFDFRLDVATFSRKNEKEKVCFGIAWIPDLNFETCLKQYLLCLEDLQLDIAGSASKF